MEVENFFHVVFLLLKFHKVCTHKCWVKPLPAKQIKNRNKINFHYFLAPKSWKKITRRTTGAQGCNFLTIFEQFWIILNYFELYRTIFAKSFLIYFGQSWFILVYLSLSSSIFVYLNVCLFILDYLGLSQSILVYLGLSHPISVYFRLSLLSQAFLAVSGYLSLTKPFLFRGGETNPKL